MVEVGLEIKKRAGLENLFIVTLSNDTISYVCHKQAYEEGGYEPGSGTNLAKGAGEIMIKEALNIINLTVNEVSYDNVQTEVKYPGLMMGISN